MTSQLRQARTLIPLYGPTLVLLVGPRVCVQSVLRALFKDPTFVDRGVNRGSRATTWVDTDNAIEPVVIWFDDAPTQGLIAHEALHAVTSVLRLRGMPLTRDTDEAYCYLLEWMVDWLTREHRRLTTTTGRTRKTARSARRKVKAAPGR